jgi:serine/threonine protein kinase
MTLIIAGVYRVTHLISSKGAYGKVLGATHKETQAEVAIKVGEDTAGTLRNEIDIYRHLLMEEKDIKTAATEAKWPTVISSGVEGKFTYLVMQKFGPSLADVANRFVGDLAAVLRVGLQMLALIEHLHNNGVVHGDIKPDNFVYGSLAQQGLAQLYILDFGLAQIISNPPPYAHIVGSPRYASVRVLGGIHHLPTRPDDLESFSYTLIYLLKGRLPWQQELGPEGPEGPEGSQLTTEHHDVTLKENYVYDATVPGEFLLLVHYCRNLKADKLPNYAYLKLILLNLYKTLQ